jgi:uncharacterized membrane protein
MKKIILLLLIIIIILFPGGIFSAADKPLTAEQEALIK